MQPGELLLMVSGLRLLIDLVNGLVTTAQQDAEMTDAERALFRAEMEKIFTTTSRWQNPK